VIKEGLSVHDALQKSTCIYEIVVGEVVGVASTLYVISLFQLGNMFRDSGGTDSNC
jgi:hypothetical protein